LQDGWPTGVNYQALRPEEIPELQSSNNFRKFQQLIRSAARNVECDVEPEEYRQQLKAEAEELFKHGTTAKMISVKVSRRLSSTRLCRFETLTMVSKAKAPDTSDLFALRDM
jgi:hypothetical protein